MNQGSDSYNDTLPFVFYLSIDFRLNRYVLYYFSSLLTKQIFEAETVLEPLIALSVSKYRTTKLSSQIQNLFMIRLLNMPSIARQ